MAVTNCTRFGHILQTVSTLASPKCKTACNIQLQTSFLKPKDSFTYPVLDCVPDFVHARELHRSGRTYFPRFMQSVIQNGPFLKRIHLNKLSARWLHFDVQVCSFKCTSEKLFHLTDTFHHNMTAKSLNKRMIILFTLLRPPPGLHTDG